MWSRSGFSVHYDRIRIEGRNPERILNYCRQKKIPVRRVEVQGPEEIILTLQHRYLEAFREAAGGRYKVTVLHEKGLFCKIAALKYHKATIAGVMIFTAIIIYQSLYVAEIEVSGYESIPEETLRETMKEAGLYEGCRKDVNLEKVKLHVYDEHDRISWIGIEYKGSLAKVTVAEVDYLYGEETVSKSQPCNIVAERSGYIESVDPQEGIRAVEKGDYVKEGDILISGTVPVQKTTYDEEGENKTERYVHAAGSAEARIPVRLNFYETSKETCFEETGRKMICVSINGKTFGTGLRNFETSVIKRREIADLKWPLRLRAELVLQEETVVSEVEITEKKLKEEVLGEIQKYVKEKLPDNAQILNKSLNFTREKNIINIGVTLETLQKIGKEEEIIVDKSNGKSEENDDQ